MIRDDSFDGAVEPWLRDPAGMLETVRVGPDGIAAMLAPCGDGAAQRGSALFNPDSIGAALLDAEGRLVFASPVFAKEAAERYIDTDLAARAGAGATPRIATVAIANWAGASMPAIFVYASASRAARWHLPAAITARLATRDSAVVLVTTLSSARSSPLEAACGAFGFNGLQTRVAMATIRHGSIKAAAAGLDISHQTAREAMAQAMKRAGVARLPALVSSLASLSFGVLPHDGLQQSMLTDLWGISPRQASLAALIAGGASRGDAVRLLGISEAVGKKELDQLYATLNVASAAALARLMVETQALQAITQATGGSIGFIERDREPLRFAIRPDGSRVAWSDYGPATGRPVLVVHSSMTSRFVSRRLVRALRDRGFRPIAIDRPGFGLTDPMAGLIAGQHDPFATAVADVPLVLAQARIVRADVIARAGAHHVLALQRAFPALLGRVVLANPDPDSRSDPHRQGALGAVKELYVRRPGLVRAMARALAGQLTHERMPRLLAKVMEGSPPDEAAIREADIYEDYFRSLRHFATGRYEGYVNEQVSHATRGPPVPLAGTHDWQIVVGGHDTLYDPDFVIDYWRRALPDAGWRKVADAGRLLTMTHADLVADVLRDADDRHPTIGDLPRGGRW